MMDSVMPVEAECEPSLGIGIANGNLKWGFCFTNQLLRNSPHQTTFGEFESFKRICCSFHISSLTPLNKVCTDFLHIFIITPSFVVFRKKCSSPLRNSGHSELLFWGSLLSAFNLNIRSDLSHQRNFLSNFTLIATQFSRTKYFSYSHRVDFTQLAVTIIFVQPPSFRLEEFGREILLYILSERSSALLWRNCLGPGPPVEASPAFEFSQLEVPHSRTGISSAHLPSRGRQRRLQEQYLVARWDSSSPILPLQTSHQDRSIHPTRIENSPRIFRRPSL